MTISITCPTCGNSGRVPDHAAAKSVKCPNFGSRLSAEGPINPREFGLALEFDNLKDRDRDSASGSSPADATALPTPQASVPIWLAATALATLLTASGAAFFVGSRMGDTRQAAPPIAAQELKAEPRPPHSQAASPPGVIVAKEIRLVGDDGKARGRFAVGADGKVVLGLNDRSGTERITLSVVDDHVGIAVNEKGGKRVGHLSTHANGVTMLSLNGGGQDVSLSARSSGVADLSFTGKDDSSQASMSLNDKAGMLLQFKGRGGKSLASLFAKDGQGAMMLLGDDQGKGRVLLGSPGNDAGASGIRLFGRDGEPRVQLYGSKDDSLAELLFLDSKGSKRINLAASDHGDSTIDFRDSRDRVRASLRYSEQRGGGLFFKGPDDQMRSFFLTQPNGAGLIVVTDKSGKKNLFDTPEE